MDDEGVVIPVGIWWISVWMMPRTGFGFIVSVFQVFKGTHTGPDGCLCDTCQYLHSNVRV